MADLSCPVLAVHGVARYGWARRGLAGKARLGAVGLGTVGQGEVWQAWPGLARNGCFGVAGQAGHVVVSRVGACLGRARLGRAGLSGYGWVQHAEARLVRAGMVGGVGQGMTRLGRAGKSRRCTAWYGKQGQGRQGSVRCGKVRFCTARLVRAGKAGTGRVRFCMARLVLVRLGLS
jgi:hypothetical protein